ncbi:MAG: 4-(cytidine 5'-diphospho)-2-C-methyl-D-erythritol kinase [Rhodobacteraceae bacterium]|nr:MAG: 4-(cytidine 5'-diphospho)-2-C-methyl-D-erythritol kinase [Paracoccaceae bacterium]
MAPIEVFAPAKINLTLHVTGCRADGYHLLDSLVAFADVGDVLRLEPAPEMALRVTGPMAAGVPANGDNLCWRAALAFGAPMAIELEKHLPAAAGIGGGSSDAAAVLRGMAQVCGRDFAGDPLALGADLPVCLLAQAARMSGIGEVVQPVALPRLHAVLVNPRVAVPTPLSFKALTRKDNPPMGALPEGGAAALLHWLGGRRNDLQAPAISLQPVIARVLTALEQSGAELVRMSGSGATCFGLYLSREAADLAARALQQACPDWWVVASDLG